VRFTFAYKFRRISFCHPNFYFAKDFFLMAKRIDVKRNPFFLLIFSLTFQNICDKNLAFFKRSP